ncbi:S41 family peptidase [Clostridium senegalense]|uniref:Tail specific protease domain-containing protein n=1 Tax=Clostridium senegalense TaxID=1465809 RepID=A0A6M0H507_9CLOT|nr:S41 family peptidase [Clostridium senegalense]NEU05785.1 hypothetical protein [Clostridium senegalense]
MKKKLIKTLTPILILSIIFAVYLIKKNSEINKKENFNRFVEGISLSRNELFKNAPSIKDEYIKWFKDGEDIFTPEETKEAIDYQKSFYQKNLILHSARRYNEKKVITYDEAEEDVNSLFKLFRYCYAAYGYFGGDIVFNEAKENIINTLNVQPSIKAEDFSNLLLNNLEFIKDGHFALADKNPFRYKFKSYYIYDKDEFFKNENGYYKIVDKRHYYIKEINKDKNIDKYMKYTINDNGKLVYSIAMLYENSSLNINTDITYSNNKDTLNESIVLDEVKFSTPNNNVPFEYSVEDNVPIAKLSAMYTSTEEDTSQYDFANSAIDMQNYPVSIIDLRGNRGGFVDAGTNWIQSYSGYSANPRGAYSYLNSSLIRELKKSNYPDSFVASYFISSSLNSKELPRIPNDKIVFVLIDKNTISAGEFFIECLMNMDNVILVGTNTSGANLCCDPYYHKLKNSSITVQLGNYLYLSPYGNEFEFNGFHPDILVDSNEALEKVQKLIKYYNLK